MPNNTLAPPTADLSHRASSLGWQTRQGFQNLGEWFEHQLSRIDGQGPSLPQWRWLEPLAEGLFWCAIAAFALGTAWLIYRGLVAYLGQRQRQIRPSPRATPPAVALPQASHWWREAQHCAQQGDYAAACKALYMAGLAQLNDTETVPYRPSRTDGEYLACMAASPSRPYELLIRTHERIVYGDALATEETYQRCRRAYREITQP